MSSFSWCFQHVLMTSVSHSTGAGGAQTWRQSDAHQVCLWNCIEMPHIKLPGMLATSRIMIVLLSEDRCLHLIHVFIHFSHWCVSWAFGLFCRSRRLWTWRTTQKSVFFCLSAVQKLLPAFWKFYSIFAKFK